MDQKSEFSRYHCSPEWHLERLRDGEGNRVPFAALLYPWALRISKKSQRFHASAEGIAEHFGRSIWTVIRALEALVAAGFFILIAKEKFRPSVYQVISHADWAQQHPGQCVVKEKMPWSDEPGDDLGKRLWNISGGKLKYQPYQLAALRGTGLDDLDITEAFTEFVAHENARRKAHNWLGRWKSVPHRFLRYLKGELREDELAKLGLQAYQGPKTRIGD